MAELIVTIILFIPVYGLLIWSYVEPEESMLFGERWMYREEPEFSKRSIRYTKFTSLMALIGIPLFIVAILVKKLILWLGLFVLIIISVIGIVNILAAEDD